MQGVLPGEDQDWTMFFSTIAEFLAIDGFREPAPVDFPELGWSLYIKHWFMVIIVFHGTLSNGFSCMKAYPPI